MVSNCRSGRLLSTANSGRRWRCSTACARWRPAQLLAWGRSAAGGRAGRVWLCGARAPACRERAGSSGRRASPAPHSEPCTARCGPGCWRPPRTPERPDRAPPRDEQAQPPAGERSARQGPPVAGVQGAAAAGILQYTRMRGPAARLRVRQDEADGRGVPRLMRCAPLVAQVARGRLRARVPAVGARGAGDRASGSCDYPSAARCGAQALLVGASS